MADVNMRVEEMNGRKCVFSGATWEDKVGYARAVRSGDIIVVSGTVGTEADGTFSSSLSEQTRRAFEIIQAALEALDGKLEHVVRTRITMADISKWREVAVIHHELFANVCPASSIVASPAGIDDEVLVEIEVDAHVI